MSLLFRRDPKPGEPLIPGRGSTTVGSVTVTPESALRHSAVWAALRLRADLISSLPLDVFRKIAGVDGPINVEVPTPPVLSVTGGPNCRRMEWIYSSQMDLDRYGNAFGVIAERDGTGLPARIDLVPAGDVTVKLAADGSVTYRMGRKVYARPDIWHERQYTVSGLPVGLSPISYAALSIGQYQSAQAFAIRWHGSGTGAPMPAGVLKNMKKTLTAGDATVMKDRFKASITDGDVFVTGNDWEFTPVSAAANDDRFLEAMDASATDIARFLSVPGDLIDAATKGSSITYANITQRNLQFLVMNLGPAIQRREEALSWGLLSKPRFVKMNTDALLRMDPQSRSTMLGQQITSRIRTPNEARALENLPPLTDDQVVEFDRLFARTPAPAGSATPQGATS